DSPARGLLWRPRPVAKVGMRPRCPPCSFGRAGLRSDHSVTVPALPGTCEYLCGAEQARLRVEDRQLRFRSGGWPESRRGFLVARMKGHLAGWGSPLAAIVDLHHIRQQRDVLNPPLAGKG